METADQERKRLGLESARRQLANGTWPEVMAVFGLETPRAPRTPDAEYERLIALYKGASCENLAAFAVLVQMKEKERNLSMSFNLSLRRRTAPGKNPEVTPETVAHFFSCPDILAGSRGGVEGAAVWLKDFSEAMPMMAPESVQVFDKIFGEAVEKMRGPSRETTMTEIVEAALSGNTEHLVPKKPIQH